MDAAQHKIMAAIKVDPESGCWLWQKAKSNGGYGVAAVGRGTMSAPRAAYIAFRGPIGQRLEMDHLCRNRACVNPYHLEAVTHAENIQRGETGYRTRRKTLPTSREDSPFLYTVSLNVRLTRSQAIAVRRLAKKRHLSISAGVRQLLMAGLHKE